MGKEANRNTESVIPATRGAPVTPSNTTDIETCRALYIGATGDVSVETADPGVTLVFKNAQAGSILPVQVTRVNATGTTATNIIALY
jgi:hypothetical protein